jgi:23S rRNA pseudouridine955/2504/2580 synthase
MPQEKSQASTLQVEYHQIDADEAGQRLDNFLLRWFAQVPKSRVYKAIRGGEVRVNKGRANAMYKLAEGDDIRIPPLGVRAEPSEAPAVAKRWLDLVEQSVLFEDADFMIINKPSGLAVHGGSGLKYGLIEVLRQLRPDSKRMELVHRLDRDTSGCLMIAKKNSALRYLHALLRDRKLTKRYHALVFGKWPRAQRMVDAPLKKFALASGERIVRVHEEGQKSKTEFMTLNRYPGLTLVEAKPITGRTHQIRVHAAHVGHCLLGDDKYSHEDAQQMAEKIGLKRLFLHAASLELVSPSGKKLDIRAAYDQGLNEALARCVNRI